MKVYCPKCNISLTGIKEYGTSKRPINGVQYCLKCKGIYDVKITIRRIK